MATSYSQASQDLFVVGMTQGKRHGTFLEIGSNDPILHNNSYLLESQLNYRGIMVEYDPSFRRSYHVHRPKAIPIFQDAQQVNYRALLEHAGFPKDMDYLQIDLDVHNRSTLNTLEKLNQTVFDQYTFATVTFEHDFYTGNYHNTRQQARAIFASRGYVLVFPDVSVFYNHAECVFEDWYVHPKLVDAELIQRLTTTESLNHQEVIRRIQSASLPSSALNESLAKE